MTAVSKKENGDYIVVVVVHLSEFCLIEWYVCMYASVYCGSCQKSTPAGDKISKN